MNAEVITRCKKLYKNIHAVSIYGSRACGYATEESDIDVLVVLDNYEKGVKYTYVKNGTEIAFLAVDRKVFEADVKNAEYGGFISDRLLNPTIPILNKDYLFEKEVEVKKRIVLWETQKLIFKHSENAEFLEVNILYFPFKKWKKMTQIYRPYLYSIENTISKDLRQQNLKIVLKGFKRAIKELGILKEVYPGWYRINRAFIADKLHSSAGFERIKMMEREAEDIVMRYMTHKKAGDSDRELVIKEAISKIKREVRHIKEKGFHEILQDPKKFLIVPEV